MTASPPAGSPIFSIASGHGDLEGKDEVTAHNCIGQNPRGSLYTGRIGIMQRSVSFIHASPTLNVT